MPGLEGLIVGLFEKPGQFVLEKRRKL